MKIFKTKNIGEIDKYTIQHEPIHSINLMERAAGKCFSWIKENFCTKKYFAFFIGPGNNGGDGLALARMMADEGYNCRVFLVTEKHSPDAEKNLSCLRSQNLVPVIQLNEKQGIPALRSKEILVDALFGSGLTRVLEGFPLQIVKFINEHENTVISIDMPSGIFGEDNTPLHDKIKKTGKLYAVKADITLSFQFPKLSFMYAENENFIGKFIVLPIGLHPEKIKKSPSIYHYTDAKDIASIYISRAKFSHKGNYGHALNIAGGIGKIGAAVLSTKACLKTGVGLITTHLPQIGYNIIQTAVPEAMASLDKGENFITEFPATDTYSAIAIGPGIGRIKQTQTALLQWLDTKPKVACVIDADGLNILSENKTYLKKLPPQTILTPHPKEFERLAGNAKNAYQRNQMQIEFAKKYNVVVVLKGAHTSIADTGGNCYFNSTGNPGMATGGTGDALTGIILSLLAQNYNPLHAARLGVFIHGLAADIAACKTGYESLITGNIIENIGKAFLKFEDIH